MSEEKEPLLEGALFNAELAGGAPPFHAGVERAAGLDLLVAADEPASLMRRLKEIADQWPKTEKRWHAVSELCARYAEYSEYLNRPEANRPHGSVLGGNHGKVGAE